MKEKTKVRKTEVCSCPKRPHDCDNCSACGTAREQDFTAEELEEIAEDTN